MRSTIVFCVALLVACTSAITPFSVPYLGTSVSPSPSASVLSIGEVISSVSQVTSFTFYVSGIGAGSATAAIALWNLGNNTAGLPISSVIVPLPNSNITYSAVTANVNVFNLNPTKAYVIYFVYPSSIAQQYIVSTSLSASAGAYVQATNGFWSAGFNKDVQFSLVSTNTLSLPYGSYSVGTGSNVNYNCYYNTSFTTFQANWTSNTINTAYLGGATTTILGSGCPVSFMPLGTANTCGWAQMYFVVDLRGTGYQIVDSWNPQGWPSTQTGTTTFSNNNQTVTGMVNGDCSSINPTSAGTNTFTGGFVLKIQYIGN